MKVAIVLDVDGVFRAATLDERTKVKQLLEEYCDEDGDYVRHRISTMSKEEKEMWENYNILSDYRWEKLLNKFTSEGIFGITDL